MKQQGKEERQQTTVSARRKALSSICSVSGLLLSVVCCIALIRMELEIQKHYRLISELATVYDQMKGEINQKIEQNYLRWQVAQDSYLGHNWQTARGEFVLILGIHCSSVRSHGFSLSVLFHHRKQ